MTEFVKAMHAFWSQFGTAYQQDQVPDGQQFPYVTYEVIDGTEFGQNALTARKWFAHREGESVNAQVGAFLDEAKAAIPPEGVRIAVGDGCIIMRPNPAGFLAYEVDPDTLEDGRKIVSGRVAYEITYYH